MRWKATATILAALVWAGLGGSAQVLAQRVSLLTEAQVLQVASALGGQSLEGSVAEIVQVGYGNIAQQELEGRNHTATIRQEGDDNQVYQFLHNSDNLVDAVQIGDRNYVWQEIYGVNAQSVIEQYGHDNWFRHIDNRSGIRYHLIQRGSGIRTEVIHRGAGGG